ncbi:MAG: DUF805 domain-containing protein [Verrucomicrobiae bacterium]|nr:DUF805 domain-containing protein [Verrucomicrobiae bacterium]
MSIVSAMSSFDGRIRRRTYWLASTLWMLAYCIVTIALIEHVSDGRWLDEAYGTELKSGRDMGFVSLIAGIAFLYPGLTIAWQRLHDMDWTGAWYLPVAALAIAYGVLQVAGLTGSLDQETLLGKTFFYAMLGAQLLSIVVLGFVPGTDGDNQHGANPRAGDRDM